SKSLIIGYQNGNIDILVDGRVTNVSAIKRAEIIGDKTIKNLKVYGDTVFVVTPFGISLLDVKSCLILATYRFGTSQSSLIVNDVAVLGDSIFAATDRGIYCAPRQGLNLLDFGNWERLKTLPMVSANYSFCEAWADTLWIAYPIEGFQNDEMILYRNGNYRKFPFPHFGCDIRGIHSDNKYLYFVSNNDVRWFKADGQQVFRKPYFGTDLNGPRDLVALNDWDYYVADPIFGLMKMIKYQSLHDTIKPNGPAYYKSFHVNVTDDEVWISGGSRGEPWRQYGIYRFKNNEWKNYNRYTTDSMIGILNISLSITNPWNPQHVIAGSYGFGIVEFLNGEIIKTWNMHNSLLESAIDNVNGYVRITGLAYDNNKNLWISQWGANHPIAVKKNDGEWQVFNFDGQLLKALASEMVSTPWGHIWVILEGKGLAVFNPEKLLNNQPNAYKVFDVKRSDGTVFRDLRTIALDNDETMWIGMKTGGVFVYYNPRRALESEIIASQLIMEVGDEIDYLLRSEDIADIRVDGGNRKWVATQGGGVFLLNEGGNKQILNLTTENSPLISNNVFSLDINKKTGEVFFATDLGTVSYVGSATEGNEDFSELIVYPSPVHKDYDGSVIIRGLVENTTIKITDLAGRLVYETYSNGGTGVWNVRDFDGNRVPSGVYLIFCASLDGSFSANTKIFVAGR
ncbi:MAG TPA: T9SS type A sorting domain-containing protein, partial [Salinivirgaceae bacterium]|nr:T9SS type A sorting domain-containing protein [Salinivirgaceae bacterium]